MLKLMPRFLLEHRHVARECGVVFASFNGFESPLRHEKAIGCCDFGTHRIWWEVEATTPEQALSYLPRYVAQRSTAIRVRTIRTP
jgi:hypothetical protein